MRVASLAVERLNLPKKTSKTRFPFSFDALRPVSYNSCAMTQTDQQQKRNSMMQTLLIVVIGQVGCLTLVVILASVFGGLWLDSQFGTKPMFTLVLLFAGIPVSVLLMLWLSRRALARLKEKYESEENKTTV